MCAWWSICSRVSANRSSPSHCCARCACCPCCPTLVLVENGLAGRYATEYSHRKHRNTHDHDELHQPGHSSRRTPHVSRSIRREGRPQQPQLKHADACRAWCRGLTARWRRLSRRPTVSSVKSASSFCCYVISTWRDFLPSARNCGSINHRAGVFRIHLTGVVLVVH